MPQCCQLLLAVLWAVGAQTGPGDAEIADKVREELFFDHAVTLSGVAHPTPHGAIDTGIDVEVSRGVVRLSGAVDNFLARERAARIAETIRGVRSVVNQIEVSPPARLDLAILGDIQEALRTDPATEAYEVDVAVTDGVARLGGAVDSYRERELVRKVAGSVRGVTGLEDDIEVRYQTDRLDSEIQHEIDETIRWDVRIGRGSAVDVAVASGVAVLSGTVGSAAGRRRAVRNAWVAGVVDVDASGLEVDPDPAAISRPPDRDSSNDLQRAVRAAFSVDPRVAAFDIEVAVDGSRVVLTGSVDNLRARRSAAEDAWNTRGVTEVDNRIVVRPMTSVSNEALAEQIRLAFLRDRYLEESDINVIVDDGAAILYGTLDSEFARGHADGLAAGVPGIVSVESHLTVNPDLPPVAYNPYLEIEQAPGRHEPVVREVVGAERRAPNRTDAEIRDQIEYELWWSPFVEPDNIDVLVENGVVTLQGAVETWAEADAAIANAYEGGATIVRSELNIVH